MHCGCPGTFQHTSSPTTGRVRHILLAQMGCRPWFRAPWLPDLLLDTGAAPCSAQVRRPNCTQSFKVAPRSRRRQPRSGPGTTCPARVVPPGLLPESGGGSWRCSREREECVAPASDSGRGAFRCADIIVYYSNPFVGRLGPLNRSRSFSKMQQMSAGSAMSRVDALQLEVARVGAARREGNGGWGWQQRTSDPLPVKSKYVGVNAGRSLGDSCFSGREVAV